MPAPSGPGVVELVELLGAALVVLRHLGLPGALQEPRVRARALLNHLGGGRLGWKSWLAGSPPP